MSLLDKTNSKITNLDNQISFVELYNNE